MSKSFKQHQKHIVITGATSGIGKQLAKDYLAQGHVVHAVGRREDKLTELQAQGFSAHKLDVTNRDAVLDWFAGLQRIDLCILAAGNCTYVDMPNFDSRIIQSMLDVNVIGMAHCIEGALPHLIQSKGQLVGIGSASAYVPFPRAEGYGTSKAAVHYLIDTLRISLSSYGVRVNLVVPGFVDTPLTKQNDFRMPFVINTETASCEIRAGIEKNLAEIHFPKKLTLPLKAVGFLPKAVWDMTAKTIINKRREREQ